MLIFLPPLTFRYITSEHFILVAGFEVLTAVVMESSVF
jgi:hypothetical protein